LKILEGTVANIPTGGGRKHPQQEFTQLDTTNILFICGGAFIGLEKVVERRNRNKSLGFKGEVKSERERNSEAINKLEPEDLIHYGLIPEFVGRLPVIGTLQPLDEDALVTILTEPKNALVKQYQRKFEFDNIGLKFTDDALRAIAHEAYKRKVGARGLMMIMEEILLESMYVLPSEKKVKDLVITKEMVERKAPVFDVIAPIEEAA
jgi:ATP-dependent Clp protease ATP-binding subunit ClpX